MTERSMGSFRDLMNMKEGNLMTKKIVALNTIRVNDNCANLSCELDNSLTQTLTRYTGE